MKETVTYDEMQDRLTVKTTFDSTSVREANIAAINSSPEFGRYKGNFVHVGRIHEGDVLRLKNAGYNLLSPDPEEWRRALRYIQTNEPHLLTVPGKPFAKKRAVWQ